jgi:flagellar biosynthesis protein FlhG
MSRGIELEEISALTKVGERALQLIEANRYHELPAPVYLQGFLKEYAKCLRLDPTRVTGTYMERYWSREKGTT